MPRHHALDSGDFRAVIELEIVIRDAVHVALEAHLGLLFRNPLDLVGDDLEARDDDLEMLAVSIGADMLERDIGRQRAAASMLA